MTNIALTPEEAKIVTGLPPEGETPLFRVSVENLVSPGDLQAVLRRLCEKRVLGERASGMYYLTDLGKRVRQILLAGPAVSRAVSRTGPAVLGTLIGAALLGPFGWLASPLIAIGAAALGGSIGNMISQVLARPHDDVVVTICMSGSGADASLQAPVVAGS